MSSSELIKSAMKNHKKHRRECGDHDGDDQSDSKEHHEGHNEHDKQLKDDDDLYFGALQSNLQQKDMNPILIHR